MRFLFSLLLLLPLLASAQGTSQAPAQTNKQLFDRTVDELNFRTFETVYDKHFTPQKYPQSLRTAAARKQFASFENNAELQNLFANYNDIAERYKSRFGNGPLTQVEFEKQLGSVLRDRNFEFFIRGLSRDDKRALIRNEERVIKQAVTQFNASGTATPPAGPQPEEPLAPATAAEPLTTHGPDVAATSAEAGPASTAEPQLRPATEPASTGPGFVGYLTLLASLGSLGLLSYLAFSLLPELKRLRRQVRALEATPATFYPAEGDAEPEADEPAAPTASRPSLFSRLRPQRTNELPADQYEDEEEAGDDEEEQPYPHG